MGGSDVTRREADGVKKLHWAPAQDLDHAEWVTIGRKLGAVGRVSNWWIGDWLRYGAARWGERYAEANRITGYDVHTLRNICWVASRYGVSLRRDNLTWSHHAALAGHEPEERDYWLERASVDKMSVADLRLELRARRRMLEEPEQDASDRTHVIKNTLICPHCGETVPLQS